MKKQADPIYEPTTAIERGALEAWYVFFEVDGRRAYEPTEPLRECGGVYDPAGWCMRAAEALARGDAPPKMFKDVGCPNWAIDRIDAAMAAA